MVATRSATDAERFDAITWALQGFDVGQRPSFWVDYKPQLPEILKRGRTPEAVMQHCPDQAPEIRRHLTDVPGGVRVLPMTAHKSDWAVVLDAQGKVLTFVACDVFSVPRATAPGG